MSHYHTSVLLEEVLKFLHPLPGGFFIDATLGGGTMTKDLSAKVGREGLVLAFDLDPLAIAHWLDIKEGSENVRIVNKNFSELTAAIRSAGLPAEQLWDGIIFDLGLSSAQLQDQKRGFSFRSDTALDMAFGPAEQGTPTAEIINQWPTERLLAIVRDYGEEKYARKIVTAIDQYRRSRPIKTTGELVQIIATAVPPSYRSDRRLNFATRTFQALRIATNHELENLTNALPQALNLLKDGGRIVVISYHSLEDRIVKEFFRLESRACLCPPEFPVCRCQHIARLEILTRKPVLPTSAEIKNNPRARSAKLRAAIKITKC